MSKFNVGDVVKAVAPFQFSHGYQEAIVVDDDPLVLVSSLGDMLWCKVKPHEIYRSMSHVFDHSLARAMQRYVADLKRDRQVERESLKETWQEMLEDLQEQPPVSPQPAPDLSEEARRVNRSLANMWCSGIMGDRGTVILAFQQFVEVVAREQPFELGPDVRPLPGMIVTWQCGFSVPETVFDNWEDEVIDVRDRVKPLLKAFIDSRQRYTLCKHCDHFVDENECYQPGYARYVHMDDGEQEYYHEAEPSVLESCTQTLEQWQISRPSLFVMHADGKVGPNSIHHHSYHGPGKVVKSQELNLDAHDESRALHRVVRAMHDGECPKCHKVHSSVDMRFSDFVVTDDSVHPPFGYVSKEGWRCPTCGFEITNEEAAAALVTFGPFMEKNLAIFEAWRAKRKQETQ